MFRFGRGTRSGVLMTQLRRILIVDDDDDLRIPARRTIRAPRGISVPGGRNGGRRPWQPSSATRPISSSWTSACPTWTGAMPWRRCASRGSRIPIIMITGHDDDADVVRGLDSGANDYVSKPFRFAVLLARIRAQLRTHESSDEAMFQIGDYSFRPGTEAPRRRQGHEAPSHREGDRDPAISLPGRRSGGGPRHPAARSLGLQCQRLHPHAGDPYLPPAAEDREPIRRRPSFS